ncbi:MAG: AAA family ATPase [Bacteroidota bacterium]
MKILKIKYKNINSLKGKDEIDFTKQPFTSGSLFAITGPTGSGKSTILDIISLALFNQIPRLGSISKNELTKTGAVITKNQLEASAEVSYACGGGNFTSKWFIAYNRNNNLNDYGMELSEMETGKILDFKKSEVPSENEKLIGLNYDQFIKSVVLAQGEFAQFLKEKKEKRAELLEKITGTGIYRELGIAAFNKFKEVNDAIKEKQAEISAITNNLLEEEEYEQKKNQLSEKEKEIIGIEQAIKTYESHINLKKEILSKEKEIKNLDIQTAESKANLDEFQQQYRELIQKHEKLQPYADSLRQWTAKHERLNETDTELKEVEIKIAENSENEKILITRAKNLCKEDIDASNLEKNVEAFFEKVSALQNEKNDKKQEYTNTFDQLKRELKDITFQINPKDAEVSIESLKELHLNKKQELTALELEMKGIDISHLPDARKKLQEKINSIFHAKQDFNQINKIKAEIEILDNKEQKLKQEKDELPDLLSVIEKEIELVTEKLNRLTTEKENRQLKAELNELRDQLVHNQPCPLCGSTEHPYAGETEQDVDELSILIKQQQKNLDQQKEKRTTKKSRLNTLKENLQEIAEAKQLNSTNLHEKEKSFQEYTKILKLNSEEIDWDELKKIVESQLENIDNIQQLRQQTESVETAIPLHTTLNQIILEGKQLDKQVKELYDGDDIYKETRKLLDKWKENQLDKKHLQETIQELNKRIENLSTKIKKLESDLLKSLNPIGFKDIAQAQSSLLREDKYLNLRNEREQYQKQLDAGLEQLKQLNKQIAQLRQEEPAEDLEIIQTLLAEQNEQKTAIQEVLDELRSQIKTHKNYLQQLEKLKKSIAETEKNNLKWRLLNELIGDAKGKKFNDFAQDLSLSQLIILANERLKDLSDRYMLDKADLETEDDSLVAIDSHMGGQRRSVKTLSGGETFILSLSMALALSDLASRNVNINSLFIDEGFGTLDPETLDQTLDTLEKLQAESSKTIGIISHVDSLKERIRTQIQLSRNGQGYSKIEIVG